MFMSGVSAFGVPADTSFLPDRLFFKSVGYTFHHGGNHIYGGGYGTEDNQNGNERCHKSFSNTVLHHKQCRYAGTCHIRACGNGHNSKTDHRHHQRVDDKAEPHAFDCIARFFEYFGVLDKYRNVCQLERSVKECGVKCLSEWLCGCCHLLCSCTDGRPSVDDIRNVYNQKPGNDADGKHGGYPAHQIGTENGNDKDENADDQCTQQIRKSCQCT